MPVTKTAKRALRSSRRKADVNKALISKLEIAMRIAKKSKVKKDVVSAISLTDRAAKKRIIHKNKAARIKSTLSRLLPKQKSLKPKTKKSAKGRSSSGRKN